MRIITCLFIFLFISIAFSQGDMNPAVDEIIICKDVQDRQPVAADSVFFSDAGSIFCYTKVSGAAADSSISHVWYYNDKEMARIKLNVKADVWRTWSSKRIVPEWTGKWHVDVESAAGKVLASKAFTVKSPPTQ